MLPENGHYPPENVNILGFWCYFGHVKALGAQETSNSCYRDYNDDGVRDMDGNVYGVLNDLMQPFTFDPHANTIDGRGTCYAGNARAFENSLQFGGCENESVVCSA